MLAEELKNESSAGHLPRMTALASFRLSEIHLVPLAAPAAAQRPHGFGRYSQTS